MYPRFLFALLLSLILLGSTRPAQASHILGGDLTYQHVPTPTNGNLYKVTARLYRDLASSVDFSLSIPLSVTNNNCLTTAPGSYNTPLSRTSTVVANPLGCATGFGYQIITYEATVEMVPGRWTLSLNLENRTGGTINLDNSLLTAFHLEAYLDNSTTPLNNSPRFTSFTLPYLCGNQPHRYSFSAFDADGDSLVYQSVPPMKSIEPSNPIQACGTAIAYTSYSAGSFLDPATGQSVSYPARTFSAALPLYSFRVVNGVAVPYFDLNPATGELLAQPLTQQIGAYVVAVRVDEFRRLGGSTWTRIGSVTRDMVYSVFANTGNRNPGVTGLSLGTQPQALNQLIRVNPGQTAVLNITGTDADAGQALRISSDVAGIIPGASFQSVGGPGGPAQGRLVWQVPATLPLGRYSCTVTLADNACPINGSEIRTLTFLVTNQVLATARAQDVTPAAAFPTPFQDQVRIQLAAATPQPVVIYDGLGRVVARLRSNASGLVLWQPDAAVPAGLYLVRTADGRQVARLLRSAAQ